MLKTESARQSEKRYRQAGSTIARPTLKTIAALSGLAVTTVSRALSGDEKIALKTRHHVGRIAREIGYQPDRAAQRLRTGRTNVISFVLDPHEEILGYGTSMIKGMTAALRNTPYHLVITPLFSDLPDIDPVRHILRNHLADGILFTRTGFQDARVRLLLEHDFPFVCHGRTELSTPHPYVDYDNYGFAFQAAQQLISDGCRRPCIILPPDRFTFAGHLRHGFLSAVAEHGLKGEILSDVTLDDLSGKIRERVSKRISEPLSPDGYVCGGEVSALAVIAAITDRGFTPGREVKLVAKQTSGLFDEVRPRVAALYENLAEAGAQMANLLLQRIAGAPVQTLQYLQEVHVINRVSL